MSKKILLIASLAALPAMAQAGVYKVAFEATDFRPADTFSGEIFGPSPVSVLSGVATIDFGEDDLGSPLLLDIHTVVDGVSHDFPNLGILRYTVDTNWEAVVIGAGPSGLQSLAPATDDFFFSAMKRLDSGPLGLIWGSVSVAVPEARGIWSTVPVTMSVTAVPEIGTFGMSLIGVGAIALIARRRLSKSQATSAQD